MPEDTPATEIVEKPVEATAQQGQKPPAEEFDKDRAMNTIHKLREDEKQWKKDKGELETLRAEKQKREQESLSEIEREKQARITAEQERDQLKRESLQRKAAEAAGLPSAFANRIQGDTIEAMTEDAKSLLEAMPKKVAPKLDPNNPAPDSSDTETDAQRRSRLIG